MNNKKKKTQEAKWEMGYAVNIISMEEGDIKVYGKEAIINKKIITI